MSHEKEASILQNITNIAMKQAKFKDWPLIHNKRRTVDTGANDLSELRLARKFFSIEPVARWWNGHKKPSKNSNNTI
jgi:hypothetical protein